jgi:hypothetical protein
VIARNRAASSGERLAGSAEGRVTEALRQREDFLAVLIRPAQQRTVSGARENPPGGKRRQRYRRCSAYRRAPEEFAARMNS